ncbi:hypothetical protein [Microbacterium sp. SA39]|uniref:hypothetical protein n=1 Tax=Microbacterium sp. SA39 TaxID=1263625 RepID=UPI00061F874D|nr:hypothetical protein [Microbacterium sp. SA39]KJQ52786.1 hypothetical protein RS85_03680 [Microbacterium sp. SA39]
MVAAVAAIPYIEGEGAAAFGIIAGINPIVAAIAAMAGNILCVIAVVLLSSRVRGSIVTRRAARAESQRATAAVGSGSTASSLTTVTGDRDLGESSGDAGSTSTHKSKGREKLGRWLVRFGVPGASLIAPLALPTMLTAAFFVASGVRKEWVILWQVIAIVLWTGAVAAAATGALALLGW